METSFVDQHLFVKWLIFGRFIVLDKTFIECGAITVKFLIVKHYTFVVFSFSETMSNIECIYLFEIFILVLIAEAGFARRRVFALFFTQKSSKTHQNQGRAFEKERKRKRMKIMDTRFSFQFIYII